jgi:hypothetical protein
MSTMKRTKPSINPHDNDPIDINEHQQIRRESSSPILTKKLPEDIK